LIAKNDVLNDILDPTIH